MRRYVSAGTVYAMTFPSVCLCVTLTTTTTTTTVLRPSGFSYTKKTWREIVEKDCQARGLNMEDATDRSRWMKQIRDD